MQTKKLIPWTMVIGRATLGPIVILGERCRWNGVALAALVLTALLSDIFDGVLARRWKTDTAALRLSDSLADTAFYLCVAAAIGFRMPAVWHQCRSGLLLVIGCEALRLTFDLIKFGKPASYHSYLAKSWGLVLATAVMFAFATQHASMWLTAAVVLGVLSNLETLAMSIMLPVWRHDVKTLAGAWRNRVELLRQPVRAKRTAVTTLGAAWVITFLLLGTEAHAQSLQHVTYLGGTALQGNGLNGKLSIISTDALVFDGRWKLVIPYDRVITYESASRKKVHVGLLTEGIWRLIAPWPEAKHLSLSYRDQDDHAQVVVLEMSRGDEALLVEVLKTRVAQPMAAQKTPLARPSVMTQQSTADR